MRQSGPFSSVQHFLDSSFKNFEELLCYIDLGQNCTVLNYGCRLARLAIPMSGFFDIQKNLTVALMQVPTVSAGTERLLFRSEIIEREGIATSYASSE